MLRGFLHAFASPHTDRMATLAVRPGIEGLPEVVHVLRGWQREGVPLQLHPGDIGWFWRFGPEATAAALRTWKRDGRILAVGMFDGVELVRLAIDPDCQQDEELARQLLHDLGQREHGVLVARPAYVEAPRDALVRSLLAEDGWVPDAAWTPLRVDLAIPLPDIGLRIETVGPEQARVRVAVQRASFERSTFTDAHWRAMADGLPYADGRCLVGYDEHGAAVAAVTVWSAGEGRPGLLEPMGVHRNHRGRGYGKAITVAAARALAAVGSSTAVVNTPRANVAAVATYRAAGFEELVSVADLRRDV